ncbi:MAG: response regulator [Candidatus Omnitrophota bacterium]
MDAKNKKFVSQLPVLDLAENRDMLTEFTAEAHKYLLNAKNSLLILDTVADDREAVENIFRSFHTIKGLAGFLSLHDLFFLTEISETLFDMIRKGTLKFEGKIAVITKSSLNALYQLIELLNEQIINDGKLVSAYPDITSLVESIQAVVEESKGKVDNAYATHFKRDIPLITIDEVRTDYSHLKEKLGKAGKEVVVDKELIETMIKDLEKKNERLNETQGRMLENQRELVRERELAIKLTQQAQSMARVKSEFLASMAHEIRTLINAILGFTDLLKRGPLNVKQKEQLDTIILSGNLLLGIVNDILDLSKVEAGKLKLEVIDFNLERLIEDIFRILRTRLNSKPIDFYFRLESNVPRNLKGDPTRLKQIFINLLDNAIKFTEKGEVGLRVSLESSPSSLEKNYTLRFVVEDTGMGIPDDRKEAIFESFTQANTSITRHYGGSGLGLALCKSYVENMGGRIWVESIVNKGSKFIFTAVFARGQGVADKEPPAENLDNIARKRFMIVKFNEKISLPLVTLCEKHKLFVCSQARNSHEAFNQLNAMKAQNIPLPDIIFIDTLLPDKSAFVLANKVRQDERFRDIKMVAVTADISHDLIDGLKKQGFDEYLAKPIIEDEFLKLLFDIFLDKREGARILSRNMMESISCVGIKVLVAEDSLPNQELLKAHFETLGCEVDYVNNGQEAIDILRQKDYDICFMDLQMPVMGGVEAAKIIRGELKKDLPIVALTAAEVEQEKIRCLTAGMNDYLAKPFDLFELKEKVILATKM